MLPKPTDRGLSHDLIEWSANDRREDGQLSVNMEDLRLICPNNMYR